MGRLARLPAKADGKGRLAGIQRVLEGEAGSDAVQRQVAEGFGWKIDGENDQHSLKSGVSVKKMVDLEQTVNAKVFTRTYAAP